MYVIQYVKNSNLTIDFEERFQLFEGLERLREFNKQALDTNAKFFIQYRIIDAVKNKEVLGDRIALGSSYRIDFFQLTKDRLSNLFSGEELQDIFKLLEEIEVQYTAEKDEYYAQKSSEIRNEMLGDLPTEQNIENFDSSEIRSVIEEKKKEPLKKMKTPKNKKNESKKIPYKLIIGIIAGLIILLVGVFFVGSMNTPNQDPLAPYEELIIERKFAHALESYPERYVDIEQEIVALGESGIPYLEDFINRHPAYEEAHFDLDYLKKDYKGLIDKSEYATTDKRRKQLVIAYIHQDELDQAHEVNHLIHDPELNREIDEIYFHLILESIKREDKEKVDEYMQYANSTEINEYINELNTLNTEINNIENLPNDKKNSFLNSRKFDNLSEQKIELLTENPFTMEGTNLMNAMTLISFPLMLILILAFLFFGFKYVQKTPKKKKEEDKSFETYLKNKMYMVALKEFPHKYPEIERTIFLQGESEIPYLEEFISKKKNYKQAHFDLFFLKKEFKEVVALEKYADTDGRKAQLAIAYIQLGELDSANDINQFIQVPELSYYLNEHYYQLTVAALRNEDYNLAYEYQDLGNSPDVDYLIDTIHLIDNKIEDININKENQDDPKIIYKLQKLKEAKAMSLNLD